MKRPPRFRTFWLAPLAALLGGCTTLQTVTDKLTSAGVAAGALTSQAAHSITRVAGAAGKAFESVTPEQEYYIGRSVGATLVSRYRPWNEPAANEYVNVLGQALAQAGERPETFGGYHFLILDTPEINAFAAPGGLIFVSRGLLRCCKSEDAVAAVLAHEICHVTGQHGIQAIRKERLTSALTILAAEGARNLSNADTAKLTEQFEGSIGDITATLVNSGYSRQLERQADSGAVAILKTVGYDPRALTEVLIEMKTRVKPEEGFGKTHPSPNNRIADVRGLLEGAAAAPAPPQRQKRFAKALGGV